MTNKIYTNVHILVMQKIKARVFTDLSKYLTLKKNQNKTKQKQKQKNISLLKLNDRSLRDMCFVVQEVVCLSLETAFSQDTYDTQLFKKSVFTKCNCCSSLLRDRTVLQ